MVGDGYHLVHHCEYVDIFDGYYEPDAGPIYCTMEEDVRKLIDDDGENRAVRAFLMLYGNNTVTAKDMAAHMSAMGYPSVPDWVDKAPGHLTKGGAQGWLRMLFELEKISG